jgi:RecA-family ATPase
MVIIDCFSDAYGGDLKDTQKIRTYLHPFQELAQKHQCLILFLHHTGKRTENYEPSKNNLLSGQGFEAKMRLVIELRADLMNPNFRHLCIVKGNYLPASYKKESYVLKFDEQNFTFTNTGERTPFELLIKQVESDNGKAKFEQASELKSKGYTYDQIAEQLGFSSKGTISKLFDKAEKMGWKSNVSKVSTGNELETNS